MAHPFFRWISGLLSVLLVSWVSMLHAQPGYSFELKKPEKYEERKLASERTNEKKFTVPRKFVQNTVTHYNYWFNANVKINEVVDRAKQVFVDDYTRLLPFYNYTLTGTSMFKTELDSVIYKSTNGILLHDLRNSWIDNLYMLLGRAFYYRNTLDSAYLTFQFVNFAFAPKDKDGYDKPIGSNANEGSNAFSISTKENRNIFDKALSEPPSRNDALIWIAKTHLANQAYPEAAGLIETLQADPQFPKRLQADLAEVTALWYYEQGIYDSAAHYLEKALPNAANKTELARWEYLLAQLLERSGQATAAKKWYESCIKHTMNPVMEVYAMLNGISQHDGSEKAIPDALEALMKMAKKDRYEKYQEIIFYTAAQIELKRKDTLAAMRMLQTGIDRSFPENKLQRARCYYELGNLQYEKRLYIAARNSYDSVDVAGIDSSFLQPFITKKEGVASVAAEAEKVLRQDSLQALADMNEIDRDAFLKKEARRLRKAQGLKEEEAITGGGPTLISNPNTPAPVTNFGSTSLSGEWYFQNKNLKSKGYSEFKRKWGSRPNIDNWRRMSAVNKSIGQGLNNNPVTVLNADAQPNNEISYASLLAGLPIDAEKRKLSNDSIQLALLTEAVLLQNRLENYPGAIAVYEELLRRFPQTPQAPEALFGLYYCYGKTGNTAGQKAVSAELQKAHAGTRYADLAAGKTPPPSADSLRKQAATRAYSDIYNQFIEGDFSSAMLAKKKADSLYGDQYWNPQLLYIEAIYYIKERQDSLGAMTLQQLIQRYPQTPMGAKATTLLDVLGRRKEIEDYLTKLEVKRPETETLNLPAEMEPKEKDLKAAGLKSPSPQPPTVKAPGINPQTGKPVAAANVPAYDPTIKLDSAGTAQIARKDSSRPRKAPQVQIDNKKQQAGVDPKKLPALTVATPAGKQFPHQPNAPQLVALVMEKVDPVYVNEARNAFARYNREKYYGQTIELNPVVLSDTIRLLTFGPFADAKSAIEYIDRAKPLAPVEIIPWLRNDKYRFILLSKENLIQLQELKETKSFEQFLRALYPGKF